MAMFGSATKPVKSIAKLITTKAHSFVTAIELDDRNNVNQLTYPMTLQLMSALDKAKEASNMRTLLFTGAGGRVFCSGVDNKAIFEAKMGGDEDFVTNYPRKEYLCHYKLASGGLNKVFLIGGYALGAGAGLMLSGDVRIATQRSVFALPQVPIGVSPGSGTSYYLNKMKKGYAHYLTLSGRRVRGTDLVRTGLATHFVPEDGLAKLAADLTVCDGSLDQIHDIVDQYTDPVFG
jgi:enoyl-CoA hydratase/carnithine racemase